MDGCHCPESGSRRQSGGECGKGLPLGAGYGAPSLMLVMGHPSVYQLRGALLGAGYEVPSLVLVTEYPSWCWLRALPWMLVKGHLPGCRLRGALLGAGYEVPPRCRLGAYSSGQNTEPLPRFTSENKPNLDFSCEGC